jgi:hypothetical protein
MSTSPAVFLMSERLEHDLGAIVAADLGDCFGELRPELVAAYRHRQLYSAAIIVVPEPLNGS